MARDLTERYGERFFTQDHRDEAARLRHLTDTYDHVTRQRIAALNLPRNARCLDVGAGPGSIAGWLATSLPDGEVVAADRDTRLLTPLAGCHPNLRVAELDITTEPLVARLGQFDLVHARFVLMHLPQRLAVLRQFASAVAPGGWIVISDSIDLTSEGPRDPAYRRVMDAMWVALEATIGTEIDWVRDTAVLLREAGFDQVTSDAYLPSVDRHSSVARFWKLSWTQLRDDILATGLVDAATFERGLAALDDPDFTDLSPGMITTTGRLPQA